MAQKPSIRNVLAKFGMKFKKTSYLLRKYHGFIRSEALATEFFGRSLDEPQAQVLNVYIEYPTTQDDVDIYDAVHEQFSDIMACFKTNSLETRDIMKMTLDDAIKKSRGVYHRIATETSDRRFVEVDVFHNNWTGRTIRIHYCWNLAETCQRGVFTPCHPSSFAPTSEMDTFWWVPVFGERIYQQHSAATPLRLRLSFSNGKVDLTKDAKAAPITPTKAA
jgi:hypothetical protein